MKAIIENKSNVTLRCYTEIPNLTLLITLAQFVRKLAIPSQRIGVLMRLRNLIPTKAKLILFKSVLSFTVPYVLPFSLAFL